MEWIRFLGRMLIEACKLAIVGQNKAKTVVKWVLLLLATTVGIGVTVTVTTPVKIVIDPDGQARILAMQMGWIITGLVLLAVVPAALTLAWKAVPRIVFEGPPYQEDAGGNNWHSRIRVRNVSGQTLRCNVSLEKADPPLDHCPIPLHWSHSRRPDSQIVTLAPGECRVFDVCRIYENSGKLEIAGVEYEAAIPLENRTVTIVLYAEQCVPYRRKYMIEPRDGVVDFREA